MSKNQSNQNNKKTIVIIGVALIIVICIVIAVLIGKSVENAKKPTVEKLQGVWGYENNIVEIKETTEGYFYSQGEYGKKPIISGPILNFKELEKGKYEFELLEKGCHGEDCVVESEDSSSFVLLFTTETDNIIINSYEFSIITKDTTDTKTIDAFFAEKNQEND